LNFVEQVFWAFVQCGKIPTAGCHLPIWWSQSSKDGTYSTILRWCPQLAVPGPQKCCSSSL